MNNATTEIKDEKASYTFDLGHVRRERIRNFREKKRKEGINTGSIQSTGMMLMDQQLEKENC